VIAVMVVWTDPAVWLVLATPPILAGFGVGYAAARGWRRVRP
jgi:hypothetical protein